MGGLSLGKGRTHLQEHPVAALTAAATSALVATGEPIQFIENHPVTAAAAVAAYGVYSCSELKKRQIASVEREMDKDNEYLREHERSVKISMCRGGGVERISCIADKDSIGEAVKDGGAGRLISDQ